MFKFSKTIALIIVMGIIFGGLAFSSEAAKKKVVEGGQNQLKGVDQGKIGAQLFNGTSRFKVFSVAYPEAGPNGERPDKGKKWVAIELEVKNARKFTGSYGGPNCKLQLVDADDQLFEAMRQVNRKNWKQQEPPRRLLQGAGLKAFYLGAVPVDFTPVRLIYIVEPKVPVYRVNL